MLVAKDNGELMGVFVTEAIGTGRPVEVPWIQEKYILGR